MNPNPLPLRAAPRQVLCLLLVTALLQPLGGCTSLQVQPAPLPEAAGRYAPGETLQLRLKRGDTVELQVVQSGPEELVGRVQGVERRLRWAEIEQIEVRRIDWLRTTLVVLGVVALGQYASGLSKVVTP